MKTILVMLAAGQLERNIFCCLRIEQKCSHCWDATWEVTEKLAFSCPGWFQPHNMSCSMSVHCHHCCKIINLVQPFSSRCSSVLSHIHRGITPHFHSFYALFFFHVAFWFHLKTNETLQWKMGRRYNGHPQHWQTIACHLPYWGKMTTAVIDVHLIAISIRDCFITQPHFSLRNTFEVDVFLIQMSMRRNQCLVAPERKGNVDALLCIVWNCYCCYGHVTMSKVKAKCYDRHHI